MTFAEHSYVEELQKKFDILTEGMDDWKMRVDTVIPVRDLDIYRDVVSSSQVQNYM